MRRIAADMSAAHGLEPDWLNDAVKLNDATTRARQKEERPREADQPVEHAFAVALGEARAVVVHSDRDGAGPGLDGHVDPGVGEAGAVLEQVPQHLAEPIGIAASGTTAGSSG